MIYLNKKCYEHGGSLTPYEAIDYAIKYVYNFYGRKRIAQEIERGKSWQH